MQIRGLRRFSRKENGEISLQKTVTILGSNKAGKTTFLQNLTKKKNNSKAKYIPTIGVDYFEKGIKILDSEYLISFWDTNGQEKEETILHQKMYFKSDAFVVFCSYDNKNSFDSLLDWINFIRNQKEKDHTMIHNNKLITTIIVINKKDIPLKKFSKKDVEKSIHEIFPTVFICELNSLNGDMVNNLFQKIIKLLFRIKSNPLVNDSSKDDSDEAAVNLLNSSVRIEKAFNKRCEKCC